VTDRPTGSTTTAVCCRKTH